DADQVLETFGAATEENQLDPLRNQQVIELPGEGELWIAGDIHDHRNNFRKITVAADLGNNPQRHLILQELIHGDHYDEKGREGSWETLYRAAEIKRDFAERATAINVTITEYLLSLPLAARTTTGIFFSHSMPTDDQMDDFDYTIFERPLTGDDYL